MCKSNNPNETECRFRKSQTLIRIQIRLRSSKFKGKSVLVRTRQTHTYLNACMFTATVKDRLDIDVNEFKFVCVRFAISTGGTYT